MVFDGTRAYDAFQAGRLGRACTQKVADWLEAGGPGQVRSIGKLRSMVREMLAGELGEIDEWVEPLLHADERRTATRRR
jgi:hypothetical protein